MSKIKVYDSIDDLAEAAADLLINQALDQIKKGQTFSVALSGGSTPLPLFRLLANRSYGVGWGKIHFFWGDERPVPREHPDSNFGQAYQFLLQPRQIPPNNIHRIQGELDPKTAAEEYQLEILNWFTEPLPRFDLILLGMGSDRHTASLFPGTDVVNNPHHYDLVAANYVPQLETWRITFTAKLINAAKQVIFLVSGEDKAEALKDIIEGPYLPRQYPAQLILPTSGKLSWLVDQDAASLLSII